MLIAHTAQKLAEHLDTLRQVTSQRRRVSLVTTRGGFHDGHGALMNAAKTVSDVVVVVIAPGSGSRRDNVVSAPEFQDMGYVEQHAVDLLYLPSEHELFPRGIDATTTIQLPQGDSQMDVDRYRLTLHLKLINQIQPDISLWGEKHFVEYHHVRQLVADLNIHTQVQCIPTVRHANGLIVDEHYAHMDEEAQATVSILYKTLQDTAHAISNGARHYEKIENSAQQALREAGFQIHQYRILNEHNLRPAEADTTNFRILGEVSLGEWQLSDSIGLSL